MMPRHLGALSLAFVLAIACSAVLAQAPDATTATDDLLARVEAAPQECSNEIRQMFRPTVKLVCGSVDEELKEFRKSWKAATESFAEASYRLTEATRWFKDGKQWRRRYYWIGDLPLLVLFNVDQRLVVLASYDTHATCRERGRQQRLEFQEAAQWQQAGLTLKRVQHAVSEFPRDARVAGINGVVLLWAVVDARGAVGNLCVVDASPRGYGFELAAMEAVGQWVYEPPTQAGQPAPLELLTRITFELGADTLLPYRALLDPYFSKP
jgi:TonB family protein